MSRILGMLREMLDTPYDCSCLRERNAPCDVCSAMARALRSAADHIEDTALSTGLRERAEEMQWASPPDPPLPPVAVALGVPAEPVYTKAIGRTMSDSKEK